MIEKGQVYLSREDERRFGTTRTVTIERTVLAKRVYDKAKQLYAVGVSRIDAVTDRMGIYANKVGKKRRVFIKAKSLLSAQYMLLNPAPSQPTVDSYGVPLPTPSLCGQDVGHTGGY